MNELQVKSKVLDGINLVRDLVEKSYGQYSGNVILKVLLDHEITTTRYTKDGYTIVNNLSADNPYIQAGIDLCKEVASRVNQLCGDSTSTVTLLFAALANNIMIVSQSGISSKEISNTLKDDYEIVANYMTKELKSITPNDDYIKRCSVIASKDEELGTLIYNMIKESSPSVSVNIAYDNSNHYEITTGCKISINNGATGRTEYTDISIMVGNDNNDNYDMNTIVFSLNPLKLKNSININLQNLGSLVADGLLKIIPILANKDGKVKSVIVDKDCIIIVPYEDKLDAIRKLYEQVLNSMPKPDERHVQQILIKFLQSQSATLYLTAETESAFLEMKDRAEDGINSTKSAMLYGIIPGRGKVIYDFASTNKYSRGLSNISRSSLIIPYKLLEDNDKDSYDPLRSWQLSLHTAYTQALLFAELSGGYLLFNNNKE